jgi:integrase
MAVYRRKNQDTFSYDFWLEGRRFTGGTGETTRRDAERFEQRQREEARETLKLHAKAKHGPMTFNVAAARYWEEVGQHHAGEASTNTLWSLVWLEQALGSDRLLTAIDNNLVAGIVARRRGEKRRKTDRLISNATVNRSVTEPLRKVLTRAAKVWKQPVGEIAWKEHMLKEPKERVRELRTDEEVTLWERLRPDYHPVVRFSILTGARLKECVGLRWEDIDWGGRLIWVTGKGDKRASIPMPPAVRDLLWPLQGHHPESVFTYVAVRELPKRAIKKGERYPLTYQGLKTAFRRDVKSAIENYRFHDNRHTAATRVLRATGNMRIVKEMLRHEDISTTLKYAHVTMDDLLAGMEKAASVTQSPTENPTRKVVGDGDD